MVELPRANPDRAEMIERHLAGVCETYAARFRELLAQAREQTDR